MKETRIAATREPAIKYFNGRTKDKRVGSRIVCLGRDPSHIVV